MSCATVLVHQTPKKEKCRSSVPGLLFQIDLSGDALDPIFFGRAGNLARHWWLWCGASLMVFGISTGVAVAALTEHLGSRFWVFAGDAAFVLSCAASSFAFLALYARFNRKLSPGPDSFSKKACGIYLVHYAFVGWLQLLLLKADLSTIGKASLVFVGASLLSWGTAAVLRRILLSRISQWTA